MVVMTVQPQSRRKPGPPATGKGTPIQVRLQPEQLQRLDDWIEEDGGRFSRPEAIRVLIEHAWGRTVASRGVKTLAPKLQEPK